jgi:hypothetical protein
MPVDGAVFEPAQFELAGVEKGLIAGLGVGKGREGKEGGELSELHSFGSSCDR